MPEQTHSKAAPFTTPLNTTCPPAAKQNTTVLTTALLGGEQYICKDLMVNVCNYKISFIGHYGQMEGSALLLNKIVKAVVESVVKEMQTKEYEVPGGFSVKVM